MPRAHLEEKPRVLLQLVWRPVPVRGGAVQRAKELERHQDAVEHEADRTNGGQNHVYLVIPAGDVRQRVQGV